jgi:hypothetical protein
MDIHVADEQAYVLRETLNWEQAKEKAWDKKTTVFGTISRFFIKGEDIEITYSERRYEPFWHIVCSAHYIYDRNQTWSIHVSSPEVQRITIRDEDFDVPTDRQNVAISGIEHCQEDHRRDVITDAIDDSPRDWSAYLQFEAERIDIESFAPEQSIVVSPQIRASSIVRRVLSEMLKPVQADVVLEEIVSVEAIDLYYKPVYAFEYYWKSKDRRTVVEFDGLTGELRREGKALRQQIGQVFTRDVLFDVGADVVGILIPGGSIAVKVAKAMADSQHKP